MFHRMQVDCPWDLDSAINGEHSGDSSDVESEQILNCLSSMLFWTTFKDTTILRVQMQYSENAHLLTAALDESICMQVPYKPAYKHILQYDREPDLSMLGPVVSGASSETAGKLVSSSE